MTEQALSRQGGPIVAGEIHKTTQHYDVGSNEKPIGVPGKVNVSGYGRYVFGMSIDDAMTTNTTLRQQGPPEDGLVWVVGQVNTFVDRTYEADLKLQFQWGKLASIRVSWPFSLFDTEDAWKGAATMIYRAMLKSYNKRLVETALPAGDIGPAGWSASTHPQLFLRDGVGNVAFMGANMDAKSIYVGYLASFHVGVMDVDPY